MSKVIKPGRLLFAVAIAALGAENLVCAYVSQLVFDNNPPAVGNALIPSSRSTLQVTPDGEVLIWIDGRSNARAK